MKTAISVPDETYERASKRAKGLGMSRSEFFSRAAARYLEELDNESLTQQIDQVLGGLIEVDSSTSDALEVGRRLLGNDPDNW